MAKIPRVAEKIPQSVSRVLVGEATKEAVRKMENAGYGKEVIDEFKTRVELSKNSQIVGVGKAYNIYKTVKEGEVKPPETIPSEPVVDTTKLLNQPAEAPIETPSGQPQIAPVELKPPKRAAITPQIQKTEDFEPISAVQETGKPVAQKQVREDEVLAAVNVLKKQIGDTFTIVEPVGSLWKPKGNTIFIRPNRNAIGFDTELSKKNFIDLVRPAGNGIYMVKVKIGKTAQKQPWEMTQSAYRNSLREGTETFPLSKVREIHSTHKESVQQALSEGKPVPKEVLKDYPELKTSKKAPKQEKIQGGIASFVRRNGRINPNLPESSDIRQIDRIDLMNTKTGRGLDGMTELAIESGYLPRGSMGTDLIQLIDKEIKTKVKQVPMGEETEEMLYPPRPVYSLRLGKGDQVKFKESGEIHDAIVKNVSENGTVRLENDIQKTLEEYDELDVQEIKRAGEIETEVSQQKNLLEVEKKNINQRFDLYKNEGIESGLNEGQAIKYARDRLSKEQIAKTPEPETPEIKGKQELFMEKGGIKGFGTGKEGENDLFDMDEEPIFGLEELELSGTSGAASKGKFGTGVEPEAGTLPINPKIEKPLLSEDVDVDLGGMYLVKPFPMPELVDLVRKLTGRFPDISKRLRSSYGLMKGIGKGQIKLNPEIFKDIEQAAKTLAHEIGHLIDYLPEETLNRGNVLGRIYSLRKFMKEVFGGDLFAGEVGHPIPNKEYREELLKVSEFWRPYDKEHSSASFKAYRNSSKELYADAISVLLNSPGTLEKMAPKFYKAFFENLDKKPNVKQEFFALEDLLNGKNEDLLKARQGRIDEMFVKGEELLKQKMAEKEVKKGRVWERIRQEIDSVFEPILKKVRELEAKGEIVPDSENPKYLLQELTMADNVNYIQLGKIDTEVIQPLEKAGMESNDLGSYFLLKRIMTERSELANPLGFDKKTAPEQLKFLEERLGVKKFNQLQDIAQRFHDIIFESVQEAVRVGTYSQEAFLEKILPNRNNYAAFGVLDHLQDYMPAGIKSQIGTLKEIANPFITTILKTMTLNRLNVLQRAKNGFYDTWAQNFPDEIEKAEIVNPQDKVRIFREKFGKGMFTRLEDGRPVGYYVDPYIEKSWENIRPGEAHLISNILGGFSNNRIFRPLYITYNAGFQLFFNPLRDFKRTYKGIPGATIRELLVEYFKGLPTAIRRTSGATNDLINEMMENFALDTPFNDFNINQRDDVYGKLLERFHVMARSDNFGSRMKNKLLLKPIIGIFKGIEFAGSTLEVLPKIAGYNLSKQKGVRDKELGYQTRNYIGTPFFREKGLLTNETNSIFMFSNIFVQAMKADIRLATNPKTKGGWWWKTVKVDILPKFLMGLAAAGAAGKVLKDFYDRVPEYDKTNYLIVPLGFHTGGDHGWKAVYARIPHDESARLISGMYWKMMGVIKGKPKAFSEVLNYGGGQFPSLNPQLEITTAWYQYLTGKNPYDYFRGRYLIPETEFKAGGWPSLKKMVQWTINQSGQTNFSTYDKSKNSTFETNLQSVPGLNRIIKISDYGLTEKTRAKIAEKQAEKAEITSKLPQGVRRLISERSFLINKKNADSLTPQEQRRLSRLKNFYRSYTSIRKTLNASAERGDTRAVKQLNDNLERISKNYENN